MCARKNPFGKGSSKIKRKSMTISGDALVKKSLVDPEKKFLLMVEPKMGDVNVVDWAGANRQWIEDQLLEHGVVLLRNFGVENVDRFHELVQKISPELLDYRERAAPRTEVSRSVYTSTEFPADQYIPLHHEMSYSKNWPTKLYFYCDLPAESGGRTPVTNDREIINLIDPKVKERFLEKKVMYVRNYGEGVDLTWQEAFQTEDRSKVEEYCANAGMTVEWRENDRLRTRSIRQVVAAHPKTGDVVWFNHAHMFHMSNLDAAVRDALLDEFGEDGMPRNAFYGDGSPIESSILEDIRETYRNAAVGFDWQQGDVMIVDNFLASHGREPFSGPRRILVAMADLYTHPGN